MDQLAQNLKAGAARAVIGTAVNGGSLEENLKDGLKAALLDTVAAQGANSIGDMTEAGALDAFTNKAAHAIAGCAVGAARMGSAGGCGAGALGAAIGEMVAEAYGRRDDTVQFAGLMSGIAAAIAGGDAAQIDLAAQAGSNTAANNFLAHDENQARKKAIAACDAGNASACAERDAWNAKDKARDDKLRAACNADGGSQLCGDWIRYARAVEASYAGTTTGNAALRDEVRFGMYSDAAERTEVQRLINSTPHASPMGAQGEAVFTALAGIALDLTPIVGDIKGFAEAQTPFDYTLVAIGALGPAGDAAKVLIKEAKALLDAGDAVGAAGKLAEAKGAANRALHEIYKDGLLAREGLQNWRAMCMM